MKMDQINLFDFMDIPNDGDYINGDKLKSVVTFDWLRKNIGKQVAIRCRTESNEYYRVKTVLKECLGTWCSGCRRIVLSEKGRDSSLLDEPLFYLGMKHIILVYEI